MFDAAAETNIESATDRLVFNQFKAEFKHKDKQVIDILADTMAQLVENQDSITKTIKAEFNKDNPKLISDYYKLNILKYLEAINFLSEYATSWISVVVAETSKDHKFITLPDISESRSFVTKYDNISQIIQICTVLDQPFEDFLKEIKSLEGHTYTEYDWKANPEATQKKVDAFKSGLIPVAWDPLFHLGIMLATWQATRDAKDLHEYERLQFMLQGIQDKRENATDPTVIAQLDKQIEYRSNQINILQIKLEKLEKRYGV
jgi:hypothetical protein